MSITYVLLNMSHALMSVMGMLAHQFKKARKVLHYKHARMKHHTTTVANITFINSGISSLNKRKKKKTKANTVKLQNPNEAAPIVHHIKQSRLGKGTEGAFRARYGHSKTCNHRPNKKTTHSKLWHKTNEPLQYLCITEKQIQLQIYTK